MLSPVKIRTRRLFLHCLLLSGIVVVALAETGYSQEPQEPQPPAEAKPAEKQPAQAQVVIGRAVDVQVAAQAVDVAVGVAGEVIVEEGLEMAGQAVQVFAMAADGDPQASRLQSKIAVDNALVRRVCKLDAEQLKQLDSLDAKWIKGKAAAGKQAGNLAAGVLRVFAGPNIGGVQQDNPVEAASRVTTAYKTKLKEILKPEQLAEYEKHVKERDEFRRQANAECVAALLEDRLSLNDEQRMGLVKSLSEWSGIQKMQATFYFQNQSYIPNLPASALKSLTPTQKKIFSLTCLTMVRKWFLSHSDLQTQTPALRWKPNLHELLPNEPIHVL